MIPEWLPNWRDASAYPDLETTTPTQWAWEFLRRNPDYQKDIEEFSCDLPKRYRSFFGYSSDETDLDIFEEAGYQEATEIHNRLARKYEIWNTAGLLLPSNSAAVSAMFKVSRGPKCINPNAKHWPYERDGRYKYIRFDLALPIKAQTDRAQRAMEAQQRRIEREKNKAPIKKRYLPGKYSRYLRLLDADLSGATHKEMANCIDGKKINDPDDKNEQSVKDGLEAAKRLRDLDYRFIPLPKTAKK